ncbi:MAG: 30S ribosomal protein S4 [Dehalococcoidales bacterium]|jgi:small subunit ribosomal protein S4|nr:30S ribosomal protein S4 [Dehalococcoidales bacterium]
MARYTEAVCRLCRRSGDKLMLKGDKCLTKCTFDKRPKAPGPQLTRRRRLSDRGVQIRQKQKVKYTYGLLERQFRRFFEEAERQPGITGDNLLVLLERRLDNVIYRLGFANSRAQARQLVNHGHFLVNGRKVNIPSYLIKEGDVIGWHEASRKSEYFKGASEAISSKVIPGWLTLDKAQMTGRIYAMPTPSDVESTFDMASVVEYYSR